MMILNLLKEVQLLFSIVLHFLRTGSGVKDCMGGKKPLFSVFLMGVGFDNSKHV